MRTSAGETPDTIHTPQASSTGPAAEASTTLYHYEEPMAVIVITVHRDRIQQTARLHLGGTTNVVRNWSRTGTNSWSSRDPEWMEHEGRIGVELAEYMEELDLPNRIANMLPRPPAVGSDAAAKAAQEVRHG